MKKSVLKIQSLICSATILSGILGMGSVNASETSSTMPNPEASTHASEETTEELQYDAPTPIISEKGYELPSPPVSDGAVRVSSEDPSNVASRIEYEFFLSKAGELLDKMNVICTSLLKEVFERNNLDWSGYYEGRLPVEKRIERAKEAYIGRANRYDVFCVLRVLLKCMESEKDKLSKDAIFCELYNFINSVFKKFKAVEYDIYLEDISYEIRNADKGTYSFLEEKVHDLSTFYFRYKLVGASADEK